MAQLQTLLLPALALVGACASSSGDLSTEQPLVRRRLALMGTGLEIEVTAADRRAALVASEAAVHALEETSLRLSTWTQDSELARLNAAPAGVRVALSPRLASELSAAWSWSAVTEGGFDPVVGALVQTWDLRGAGRRPTAHQIELARSKTGHDLVRLDESSATLQVAGAWIEEGGFGKGAGLDHALAALERAGVTRAVLDLGGQLAFLGEGQFPVEVAHPRERDSALLSLAMPAGSVATSGNSERGLVVDGILVGHLLDPRTGHPANDFGSVTVWAESALAADALATGCFVLGPERALALGRELHGVEVLVVETRRGGELAVRATPGWGLGPEHVRGRYRGLVRLSPLE
ncbi:MAG: FAD:protein FMN transferase [Planctomycetota bacterium]|nr:FAD:protein FMN transferase [Planctomycetota bacterium]